jgi:hypothetical protein
MKPAQTRRTLDMASGDADRLPPIAIVVLLVAALLSAAFNTVMATVGFILNRVTRLDDQSIGAGLTFASLSVLVVVVAPMVALRRQ